MSQQNALPFLIKDQYQKINHIEADFVTKCDLARIEERISRIESNYVTKLDLEQTNAKIDDLRYDLFREIKKVEKISRVYFGILTTLIILSFSKGF